MEAAKKNTSKYAQDLYKSGHIAFQNKAYKEAISYFKKAQALGLDFIDDAEANRFIGSAYLELQQGGKARKYLRRATTIGMFSASSIFMLAHAEENRSPLYKWIAGDDHSDKVEELLDWFLLSHIPEQDRLKTVALNAFKNKKWYKAVVLFEDLKIMDRSNIEYQTYSIFSYYHSGELFRANYEIEDLFSKTQTPPQELLPIRAEICMILGDFVKARECYAKLAQSSNNELTSILPVLDLYVRVHEISEDFDKTARLFFTQEFYSKSFINSIDNVAHFELVLNSISTYWNHYQDEQKLKTQEIMGTAASQFMEALDLVKKKGNADISRYPKPNESLTPFERWGRQQKSELEAIKELQKFNSVMNTSTNASFAQMFDREILKSGLFLKTRLWLYKLLLIAVRALLFFIPVAIFIDGLFDAMTGNNLLALFIPSIASNTIPGTIQIVVAVIWFLLLIFADSVLMAKINNKMVDTLRETLVNYISFITYTLVSGEAVYEYLKASQPIPHLDMDTAELLKIGINAKKPWELMHDTLVIVESKAKKEDILPYVEDLKALLTHEKLGYVAARLLASVKIPDALPIIEHELLKISERITENTEVHNALKSLAKYGESEALSIIRDFAVRNSENFMMVFASIEAIKLLPPESRISIIGEIFELGIEKKIEYRSYLEILRGLGDHVVSTLINFINRNNEKIEFHDRYELILAILNSASQSGFNVVKNWIVSSDTTEALSSMSLGLFFDFLLANNQLNLMTDIAVDEKVNPAIRKIAISKLGYFEKENIQNVVFDFWQHDEPDQSYIEILGDIGTTACVEKLMALLGNDEDIPTNINTEYMQIFVSLALSGDLGESKLRSILKNPNSSIEKKMLATASLYGKNQDDVKMLRMLKGYLLDNDINKYSRGVAILVSGYCISRKENTYFKTNRHSLPAPKRYYAFLSWVKKNSRLPDEIRVNAELELGNSSLRDFNRALWLPKSYNKFEVFWAKLKKKLPAKQK